MTRLIKRGVYGLVGQTKRPRVLGALHANIQDVFNEHGVQIISPHYRDDKAQPVVVPKERWAPPPARSDDPMASA